MDITDKRIDGGKAFDWGKTSADYASFRDVYPQEFYDKILNRKMCISGQSVLDIGTGTGVLPRNMYRYGAKWIGTDISENQIEQAKILSKGKNIDYYALSTENIEFPSKSFDVITACQCFWYFNHEQIMPKFYQMLKPDGRILILKRSSAMFAFLNIMRRYEYRQCNSGKQGKCICTCDFLALCLQPKTENLFVGCPAFLTRLGLVIG